MLLTTTTRTAGRAPTPRTREVAQFGVHASASRTSCPRFGRTSDLELDPVAADHLVIDVVVRGVLERAADLLDDLPRRHVVLTARHEQAIEPERAAHGQRLVHHLHRVAPAAEPRRDRVPEVTA